MKGTNNETSKLSKEFHEHAKLIGDVVGETDAEKESAAKWNQFQQLPKWAGKKGSPK